MAPTTSKSTKSHPKPQFFALRPRERNRRNVAPQDYTTIERHEVNPSNPPRASMTSTTSTLPTTLNTNNDLSSDIIVCDPGNLEYESDEEMPDAPLPRPTFTNIIMTEVEKMEAIKKWVLNRERHERKKKEKTSHVYWYMKREVLPGVFYSEFNRGLKYFQEYRWQCRKCLVEPNIL